MNIANLGTDLEDYEPGSYFEINEYSIIGADNKYFTMDSPFPGYVFNQSGVSDLEYTDLVWDGETNNLTFSFSFTVDAENNNSNHELTVSGDVDVILLEEIQP